MNQDKRSWTEKELKEAAAQAVDAMLQAMPSPSACDHAFSPEFISRMEPLIQQGRSASKKRRLWPRVAAVIAAVLLSLGTWLTVDVEAREVLFGWVKEVYDWCVNYRFFSKEPATAIAPYEPSWIPEGFSLTYTSDQELGGVLVYSNKKTGQTLVFGYDKMSDSVVIGFGGDLSQHETLTVQGLHADFYHAAGDSTANNLIWFDESAGVVFTITGDVEKDVILHMAESVSLADSPKN